MPTVFNAANERAVALFLDNKIKFLQIYELIRASMENHKMIENPTVEQILAAEQECYEFIKTKLNKKLNTAPIATDLVYKLCFFAGIKY